MTGLFSVGLLLLSAPLACNSSPKSTTSTSPNRPDSTEPPVLGKTSASAGAVIVSGAVRDVVSGSPLAGVQMDLSGTLVTSGSDGGFELSVAAGRATLLAALPGYLTYRREVFVIRGMTQLTVRLAPEGPSATIGPDGGTVVHRGASIAFAAGAFGSPTAAKLTMLDAMGARTLPGGRNFVEAGGRRAWLIVGAIRVEVATQPTTPAMVLMPMPNGLAAHRLALLGTDAAGAREVIRPAAKRGRWLEFSVAHFSDYELGYEAPLPSNPPEPAPVPPDQPAPVDMSPPPPSYDMPGSTSTDLVGWGDRAVAGQVTQDVNRVAVPHSDGTVTESAFLPGAVVHAGDQLADGSFRVEDPSGGETQGSNTPAVVAVPEGLSTGYVAVEDDARAGGVVAKLLARRTAFNEFLGLLGSAFRTTEDGVANMAAWTAEQAGLVAAKDLIVVEYRRVGAAYDRAKAQWRAEGMAIEHKETAFVYTVRACADAPSIMLARFEHVAAVSDGTVSLWTGGASAPEQVAAGMRFVGCTGLGCDPQNPGCRCGPTNCAAGCCDANGDCQLGDRADQCGGGGATCVECGTNQGCSRTQTCEDCGGIHEACCAGGTCRTARTPAGEQPLTCAAAQCCFGTGVYVDGVASDCCSGRVGPQDPNNRYFTPCL